VCGRTVAAVAIRTIAHTVSLAVKVFRLQPLVLAVVLASVVTGWNAYLELALPLSESSVPLRLVIALALACLAASSLVNPFNELAVSFARNAIISRGHLLGVTALYAVYWAPWLGSASQHHADALISLCIYATGPPAVLILGRVGAMVPLSFGIAAIFVDGSPSAIISSAVERVPLGLVGFLAALILIAVAVRVPTAHSGFAREN